MQNKTKGTSSNLRSKTQPASNGMRFIPVRTRRVMPPKDDLYAVLDDSLPRLHEGDIVFITSKVLAIHQGRCIKIEKGINKRKLVLQEAERYVENRTPYWDFILTIKDATLIPSAGIDESNGNGYYILWPEKPFEISEKLHNFLKKKHKKVTLLLHRDLFGNVLKQTKAQDQY